MKQRSNPDLMGRRFNSASFCALTCLGLLWLAPPVRGDEPARRQLEPRQQIRPGDPAAHGLTAGKLDELRGVLRAAVEKKTVPGISLILVHRGEIVFTEAFGNLTVDSRVQMASSSKPVTASLLLVTGRSGKALARRSDREVLA